MDAEAVHGWTQQFDHLTQRISDCFCRCDLRRRAIGYLRGLLGQVQRKNSWQLAECVGDESPHGIQRLLDRSHWDVDKLRDQLVCYTQDQPSAAIVGQPAAASRRRDRR